MSLLPAPFLFRYTIPVQRVDQLPRAKAPLLGLPKNCEIPFPSAIDGTPQFATLELAWNPQGLAIKVSVTGKSRLPKCNPDSIGNSDRIHIWIDTRDTQNVHRASRFCHQFVLLPCGEGSKGEAACIHQLPIARAKEDSPEIDADSILMENVLSKTEYEVTCWFPAETLTGFDPEAQSRIGFYLNVIDTELGKQPMTVDEEFPFDADPSLWVSLDMQS